MTYDNVLKLVREKFPNWLIRTVYPARMLYFCECYNILALGETLWKGANR